MHWSKSRHTDYTECPRRFFYSNIAAPHNPDIARLSDIRTTSIARHETVRRIISALICDKSNAEIDLSSLLLRIKDILRKEITEESDVNSELSIIEICLYNFITHMHHVFRNYEIIYSSSENFKEFVYKNLNIMCQPELTFNRNNDSEIVIWRTGQSVYRNEDDFKLRAFGLTCWGRTALGIISKPITVTEIYLRDDCLQYDIQLTDVDITCYHKLACETVDAYSSSAKIRNFPAKPDINTCRFCNFTSICIDYQKYFEVTYEIQELVRALSGTSDEINHETNETYSKDVFLCHVSEDKEHIVRPFARMLEANSITFWLDEAEIRWGDSLIRSINKGLKESRFLICFISESFIGRGWPEGEVGALLCSELSEGGKRILPIYIAENEMIFKEYPLFRDKKSLRWEIGIENIIKELRIIL